MHITDGYQVVLVSEVNYMKCTIWMCKEETTVRLNSLKMALMDAITQSENQDVI
jgi:hypothetical protein